jgi:hypothetical protein
VVLVVYLWWVKPRSLRALFAQVPTAGITAIALGIVAVLGFALNDSGITIPGMMAAVAEATVVILLARLVFAAPSSAAVASADPRVHRPAPAPGPEPEPEMANDP